MRVPRAGGGGVFAEEDCLDGILAEVTSAMERELRGKGDVLMDLKGRAGGKRRLREVNGRGEE
jgi:hypothetical protein